MNIKPIALKLVSALLTIFGIICIAALFYPATAEHLNPRVPLFTTAIALTGAGIGLWRMKRWGLYLFLFAFIGGALYNLVALGAANVGNAWIGLAAIAIVALMNWRSLK
jgi:Na+/melibiose symporter-like transporter